jgi:hypothetical protein
MRSSAFLLSAPLLLGTIISALTNSPIVPWAANHIGNFLANNPAFVDFAAIPNNPNCGSTPGPATKTGVKALTYRPQGQQSVHREHLQATGAPLFAAAPTDPATRMDATGIDNPSGGSGTCTVGAFDGCNCDSTCSRINGPCNANGHAGINSFGGLSGVCVAGSFAGRECQSIFDDYDRSCSSNGC